MALRPTETPRALAPGALRLEVSRVLLTEDVPSSGWREDDALAVEVDATNLGAAPRLLDLASLVCLLELDAAAPAETLALPLAGAGAGGFPGAEDARRSWAGPLPVAPGETRRFWAVFRGYRYPGSDVPRKVVLAMAGSDGPLRLVLADPAHGGLRWALPARRSGWMLGVDSIDLLGGTTRALGVSPEITLVRRLGGPLLDVSLVSPQLVQTQGSLLSRTSGFAGTGLAAHLAALPVVWGPDHDPRRFGLYAGGAAQALVSIDPPPPAGETPRPHVYGVLAAEVGLDLEIGALAPARGPFPVEATGAGLPRWYLRAGYTHWFVDGGGADGYSSGFRLAW